MQSIKMITGLTLLVVIGMTLSSDPEVLDTAESRRPPYHHPENKPSYPYNPRNPNEDSSEDIYYDPRGLGFEIAYQPHKEEYYQLKESPWRPSNKPPQYHAAEPDYGSKYHQKEEVKPSVYEPSKPYHQPAKYSPAKPKYPVPYDNYYCPKIYKLETKCRPVKECAVWYDLIAETPGTECKLGDGSPGACCPDLPYNGRGNAFKVPKKDVKLYRDIDLYSINAAARAGQFNGRLMDETEKLMRANNVTVQVGSSSYTHLLFFQTKMSTLNISRGAFIGVETTKELGKRFELNADEAGFGLSQFSLRGTILSDSCPADPVCDEDAVRSPFRTMDGSCNNLARTAWGKSNTQVQRALVAVYADGVWAPKVATSGRPLPSARLVSISVVPDLDAPSPTDTLWVMQYGQFVDHDLTSTPVFRMNGNGMGIVCCTEDGQHLNNSEVLHPECLAIDIPKDDPFFVKFGQRCMNFVRSTPAPRLDCNFGHGEQMNQLTHFLDHSNVYGSDVTDAAELRTFKDGQLKVTPRKGHHELDLLPPDLNAPDNCTLSKAVTGVEPPAEVRCFKAGDARSNENPDLAVTQTIFLRQHNRLATELSYLNPGWNDERLYQEARRIMIAQMQHITYNEFLPIVIGREKMEELGLLPLEYGFSKDYDQDLNPTIMNEFSTAAYRFGHSLIQGKAHLVNQRRKKESSILLREHFFKSQIVYTPGNVDKFLIGLATQPMQEFDNYFTEEVTNHLFEQEGKGFGLDLVSLNIQRGRDHGLQGYNAYRALCGLPRAEYFHDLLDVIPPAIVERFELLYDSVDDVDLFIGGVSERPVPGALVGPTFQCILADQFLRLKRGDRFFYDLGGQPGSFTEEQLNEIRTTSLARLICDNSHVSTAQPLAFKFESALNPIVNCDDTVAIPQINLLPWKEAYYGPEPYAKKSYPPAEPSNYHNHHNPAHYPRRY